MSEHLPLYAALAASGSGLAWVLRQAVILTRKVAVLETKADHMRDLKKEVKEIHTLLHSSNERLVRLETKIDGMNGNGKKA